MDEAALRPYREYHAQRELRAQREALRRTVLERAKEAIRRSAKFLILGRNIEKDLASIEKL